MRWWRLSFLCLAVLFLTGWGHLGPRVKIGLLIDRTEGREPFLKQLGDSLVDDNADLLFRDAKGDATVQESQVHDLIQQGIQVLVLFPCDASKAGAMISAAHQAGIKAIALGKPIPDCDLDYLIDFNREKAGELQAESLVKKVPQGHYVLLGGVPGEEVSMELRKGQMKVLQSLINRGDIQIVSSINATSSLTPKDLKVLSDPKVDAILTSNSIFAEGAIQALAENKRTGKVVVAGIGEDLDTCRRIASGAQLMTVYRPPQKLAEETAYLAAKVARKAKEFDCQFVEVPNGPKPVQAVLLSPKAVDAKNLDSTVIGDHVQKKEEVYGK